MIVSLFGVPCELQIPQCQSQTRSKTGRPQVLPADHPCVARLSDLRPRLEIRNI